MFFLWYFKMAQAKTLSDKDLKTVLSSIAVRKHSERNRAMLLLSTWGGMRVGEIAALHISDVLSTDGAIRQEVNLTSEQTKGSKGRTVIFGEKLRKEIALYVKSLDNKKPDRHLFYSQKSTSFTANALCQLFGVLYKTAQLDGATSHSGRRTYITTLANKGVSVRVLMALAGHKNMSTTQRYIDLNTEMLKSAANLL